MTTATKQFRNRIALIFDFDKTLAPDTYSALLKKLGYDPDRFQEKHVQPLIDDGWEEIMARAYALKTVASAAGEQKITREYLAEVGRNFTLYDGAESMFDQVRQWAHAVIDDIEVEFYLLTAGFIEIPQATVIAKEFKALWGGALHFDEDGEIAFVKRIVTHPEKVRYVLQLAKGLQSDDGNNPANAFNEVPEEEWYLPLSQVIYVGDGASDMPVFSLMNERQGLAIGVFQADQTENWAGHDEMTPRRRVQNLAPADYSQGSELMNSLQLAVESVCKQIALRRLSINE